MKWPSLISDIFPSSSKHMFGLDNQLPDDEAGDELVDDAFRWRRDSQSVIEWRLARASWRVTPLSPLGEMADRGDVSLAKSRATERRFKPFFKTFS